VFELVLSTEVVLGWHNHKPRHKGNSI